LIHKWFRINRLAILLAIFISLGCGGGGGGGSAVPTRPASLTYTGSTARAVINESNAAELASEAVSGGTRANVFTGFAAVATGPESADTNRLAVFASAMVLQNAVVSLHAASPSSTGAAKAVFTEQETINGTCGGTAFGDLQADDVTGDFSGHLSFSNFCESNVTVNGDTDFSGTINTTTDQIEIITFNFGYLTSSEPSGSFIIDGTMSIVNQPAGFTITMDMYLKDGNSGDVCWIDNYHIEAIEYASYVSMAVSGVFYDPQDGYVSVSTLENLIVYDYDRVPASGVILAEGENGVSGGPTMARLTCYPSGLFNVQADTDGDGIYDWDSGDLSWNDY
jgi:hypothetical protein